MCVVGNTNNHKQPEIKEWEETNVQIEKKRRGPPQLGDLLLRMSAKTARAFEENNFNKSRDS